MIKKHVIINTGSTIDHDCQINDYVHIAPGCNLCGKAEVGEGILIGTGTVIIPGIKIGKWCVIGAGSVVIKDIPDYSVAVSSPCRVIKKNVLKEMEKYTSEYYANGISSFLKMTWTASKNDLTTLVYGLHYAKAINEGNMSLNEFKRKVEIIFNIDLGHMSSTLRDISQKKNPYHFFEKNVRRFNQ